MRVHGPVGGISVGREQVGPALVADRARQLRRPLEIAEQDCPHDAWLEHCRPDTSDEMLDLRAQRLGVAEPGQMLIPVQRDEAGSGNPFREIASCRLGTNRIVAAAEHQRRHANRRQELARVDQRIRPGEGDCGRRARCRLHVQRASLGEQWVCIGVRKQDVIDRSPARLELRVPLFALSSTESQKG